MKAYLPLVATETTACEPFAIGLLFAAIEVSVADLTVLEHADDRFRTAANRLGKPLDSQS